MPIPHQPQHNQPLSGAGKKPFWFLCLFILFSAGIIANFHQPLNASGQTATELTAISLKESGLVQEIEQTARGTDPLANTPSIWPASGPVTSGFGWRNSPLENGSELHQGIDIASGLGIPVVATADGQVVKSGWAGGYGNIVQIDHGNGLETIYGHNSQVAVTAGQSVRKGQLIAYAGSTGKSTGPHVHYEVRANGVAIDPIKYMLLQ